MEMGFKGKITLENDRPAVQGVYPVCGTKEFMIGKATDLVLARRY